MARPLRIERPGLWYHVTGRRLERRSIFADNLDREHWLGLLGEGVERWRLVVHAYVLMDNHHHLMLETQEANPHGDWGRELVRYSGRHHGGLRLVELG